MADSAWAEALTLDLIRAHTKTDDDETITDAMMELYRDAAIEACEKWTGTKFGAPQTITDTLIRPQRVSRRPVATIFLSRSAMDDFITLTGGALSAPARLPVRKGTNIAQVPMCYWGFSAGCGGGDSAALRAVYRSGANCGRKIPAPVIMGCLKYIAWQIGNPGDQAAITPRGIATFGANDAVTASGAADEWRDYRA